MSEQPANTAIKVIRTVRSRTLQPQFACIKDRAQRLGYQEVMTPGEEIDFYLTVDGDGTNAPGPNPAWRYGMPLSVNRRTRCTVAQMTNLIALDPAVNHLDFPIQLVAMTADRFLRSTTANLTDDLFAVVAAKSPAPRGLIKIV
jgi:hypothetical protein